MFCIKFVKFQYNNFPTIQSLTRHPLIYLNRRCFAGIASPIKMTPVSIRRKTLTYICNNSTTVIPRCTNTLCLRLDRPTKQILTEIQTIFITQFGTLSSQGEWRMNPLLWSCVSSVVWARRKYDDRWCDDRYPAQQSYVSRDGFSPD